MYFGCLFCFTSDYKTLAIYLRSEDKPGGSAAFVFDCASVYQLKANASFQLEILSQVKFEFRVQTRTLIFLSLIPKLTTQNNFEFF